MKPCKIYLTGIRCEESAFLIDDHILIAGEASDEASDYDRYPPRKVFNGIPLFAPSDATWWAQTECEGRVQFEVDGKWGFCHNHTGKIFIKPQWDFAGPFYNGFALVSLGCTLTATERGPGIVSIRYRGGKYGFIDRTGKIVIPVRFNDDDIIDCRGLVFDCSDGTISRETS